MIRRWSPDPPGLLELWRHEAPRTLRVVGVFADGNLAYRPVPGARTVGSLIAHVIDGYDLTRHWLASDHGRPAAVAAPPSSIADALRALRDAQEALFSALERRTVRDFETLVAPFGVPEPRAVMALGMLKHEIHHRGELHALARVCGRAVPHLYEPIAGETSPAGGQ